MSDEHRAVVIDTETTGFGSKDRIIELGAVEIVNRKIGRTYAQRIQPFRDIDEGAYAVHKIALHDLKDEPAFVTIAQGFLDFVGKADIIGHNINFDLRFLDIEYNKLDTAKWTTDVKFNFEKFVRDDPRHRSDVCTMKMSRAAFPQSKHTLDALCDNLKIDRKGRGPHGALVDAKLTALCWLAMTRGNRDLFYQKPAPQPIIRLNRDDPSRDDYVPPLIVIKASDEEVKTEAEHLAWLADDPFYRGHIVKETTPQKGETN